MSEVTKVKPTIDTSLFAKICADSMEQARGKPFTPIQHVRHEHEWRNNTIFWLMDTCACGAKREWDTFSKRWNIHG